MNIGFLLNTPRRLYKERKSVKKLLSGQIDKLVYLSPSYIDESVKRNDILPDNLVAIPNACEDYLLNQGFIPNKKKQIIWCGRIVHNPKNILFLAKLWKHLFREFPDWEMILIGDGCDRQFLERKIKKYGLERIRITGYTNPYPYYAQASIFVLPSFHEGFGMSLIEAMSFSCVPVVFDTTSAFRDIITDGVNGFIIPDYKEKLFIEVCSKLMSSDISTYSYQAKKSTSELSMDIVGRKWQSLFRSLVNNK